MLITIRAEHAGATNTVTSRRGRRPSDELGLLRGRVRSVHQRIDACLNLPSLVFSAIKPDQTVSVLEEIQTIEKQLESLKLRISTTSSNGVEPTTLLDGKTPSTAGFKTAEEIEDADAEDDTTGQQEPSELGVEVVKINEEITPPKIRKKRTRRTSSFIPPEPRREVFAERPMPPAPHELRAPPPVIEPEREPDIIAVHKSYERQEDPDEVVRARLKALIPETPTVEVQAWTSVSSQRVVMTAADIIEETRRNKETRRQETELGLRKKVIVKRPEETIEGPGFTERDFRNVDLNGEPLT